MEQKSLNTIIAHHFFVRDERVIIIDKDYYWHIPKNLRNVNIIPGDVVRVSAEQRQELAIVTKVFREEIEETSRLYKPVIGRISQTITKKQLQKYSNISEKRKALSKFLLAADGIIKPLEETLKLLYELKKLS